MKNQLLILVILSSLYCISATRANDFDEAKNAWHYAEGFINNRRLQFSNIFGTIARKKIRRTTFMKALLAQGIMPIVREDAAYFEDKEGKDLCKIDSRYKDINGNKYTEYHRLNIRLSQFGLDFLKHYDEVLKQTQAQPNREVLNVAIENDYAYIVELVYKAGVIPSWADWELAKDKKAIYTGNFLMKLPYFQTMHKIRQVSKVGLGLPEEITNYICKSSN